MLDRPQVPLGLLLKTVQGLAVETEHDARAAHLRTPLRILL